MESTRSRILALKRSQPEISTRDLGHRCGVSGVRAWQVLVDAGIVIPGEKICRAPRAPAKRTQPSKPKFEIRPHAMPWATLSLLTGGSAKRAKLQPA